MEKSNSFWDYIQYQDLERCPFGFSDYRRHQWNVEYKQRLILAAKSHGWREDAEKSTENKDEESKASDPS